VTQYATVADYFGYMGQAVPVLDTDATNALNSLLQRASDRIVKLTRTARYSRDADGNPAPASVRDAFARATAAQAMHMRRAADEGDGSDAEGWDSISLIGVSFARNSGTAAASGTGPGGRYSLDAIDILAGAGIASTVVAHPGY
jgi:hypothetical protein